MNFKERRVKGKETWGSTVFLNPSGKFVIIYRRICNWTRHYEVSWSEARDMIMIYIWLSLCMVLFAIQMFRLEQRLPLVGCLPKIFLVFPLQMDRHNAVPTDGRAPCVPVLRRASSKSQVPDQHSASQKHDVHLEYAQKGRTDASVSETSPAVSCHDTTATRSLQLLARNSRFSHNQRKIVTVARLNS